MIRLSAAVGGIMRNATQERILHLLRWLQEETNPQHPLSSVEILDRERSNSKK